MRIALDIERLVLDGLPIDPAQAHAVTRALHAHLAELLATPDTWPRVSQTAERGAGATIDLAPGAGPASIGRAIARSLHGALHAAPVGHVVAPHVASAGGGAGGPA